MQAGMLNKRITIQTPPTSPDSFGEATGAHVDVCTIWASIVFTKGREVFSANRENPKYDWRIRVRYRSDIADKMRVEYGSRYFRIEALDNVCERDVQLLLYCSEIKKT